MVIHACSSASFLLLRITKAGHIAVVIVAPGEHHIFGHIQSVFVNLKYFLVGYKLLRNLLYIWIYVLLQKVALIINHLLQSLFLFLHGFHSFHGAVVYAAHPYGINILFSVHFFEPFDPITGYRLFVRDVVVSATFLFVPFSHVVAHKRFTVGCPDDYSTTVGGLFGTFDKIKRCGSAVHSRPDGIGTKAHQKFENFFIRTRTDLTLFIRWFESHPTPGLHGPVFIVEEYTAELYGRALECFKIGREYEFVLFFGGNIAPPDPG